MKNSSNNSSHWQIRLMNEDAPRVNAEHETIVLKGHVFDEFMEACDKAKAPNKALLEAAKSVPSPEATR